MQQGITTQLSSNYSHLAYQCYLLYGNLLALAMFIALLAR